MKDFMIGEKAAGKYVLQFNAATKRILEKNPEEIAALAGVDYNKERNEFTFKSLGESLTVSLPDCGVSFTGTDLIPIYEWRIVALHYLSIADGVPLSAELIPYRKMQGGIAYGNGFEARSNDWLVKNLGDKKPADILKACEALSASIGKSSADVYATFEFLPKFPITIQLWLSDEEMVGAGQVLFNARAKHYLSAEDTDVAGSLVVDFLVAQFMLENADK